MTPHPKNTAKSRKSLDGRGYGYLRAPPCIPPLKCVGKPVPYRTPCGLEMDPLAVLRNQVAVQQLSHLQSKSYQGGGSYGNEDEVPYDCCLLGGTRGGNGTGRRGDPRGGQTRQDLCTSGGLLAVYNPITLAFNDSTSNATFVSFGPASGVTTVHDFAGGGPCGQRGSSSLNGGPGWRLR